ncbi:hypothetical protein SERLA73DRAFT_143458 [Serpula lacrymans var. lacrymans S7.3]|uniref:Uncharacterized protein n=2 Tax=Serpula lacrymans var. lacrymans TaxID=341189 RepID=F8QA48_SERL3|nr:uncharacterized protein SERLADRAFT_400155 [Serpula lacrymans var. lacrymans S7.9]EGN94638.1 hypothetical protein SERLA73DRAFT_143458 [Serpula lacrymans var. lacrymans S7.3]EGO20118.1 hypothetical protein SERLADRAFT_400155 [Serpula lacrymans var. lacrymans S7.9]
MNISYCVHLIYGILSETFGEVHLRAMSRGQWGLSKLILPIFKKRRKKRRQKRSRGNKD